MVEIKQRVEKSLGKIKPLLEADGGSLELVEVTKDGVVRVRLQGACAGCPGAQMTLKMGIEKRLKEEVPEVRSVESVI